MDVHTAVARQFQNFFGQELPEGRDDKEICLLRAEQVDKARIPRAFRLCDRNTETKRLFLDRRKLHRMPSAPRLVGLRHNQCDLMARLTERAERRNRKIRRSEIDDSHASSSSSSACIASNSSLV